MVTGAIVWSVGGTAFLILLGWLLRLVGVEYDLQKKEAAYRKILVIAEDDNTVRPKTIEELIVLEVFILNHICVICISTLGVLHIYKQMF